MTLMESLPPFDWSEIATKDDLAALEQRMIVRFDALRIEMVARIDSVRAELRGEIAELRGEIVHLRGETKLGIARMTYVTLAGFAAAVTPIYLALFAGLGA